MNDTDPTGTAATESGIPLVAPVSSDTTSETPSGVSNVPEDPDMEAALNAIVADLLNDIPATMRDLVPNLPPVEKALWIRQAVRKGLFAPPLQALPMPAALCPDLPKTSLFPRWPKWPWATNKDTPC